MMSCTDGPLRLTACFSHGTFQHRNHGTEFIANIGDTNHSGVGCTLVILQVQLQCTLCRFHCAWAETAAQYLVLLVRTTDYGPTVWPAVRGFCHNFTCPPPYPPPELALFTTWFCTYHFISVFNPLIFGVKTLLLITSPFSGKLF